MASEVQKPLEVGVEVVAAEAEAVEAVRLRLDLLEALVCLS